MSDVAFWTARALAEALRQRRIGCLELLDHHLNRVDRLNPPINAVVVRRDDEARAMARAADAALARGEVWGPLHGLPMTIKESNDLAGTSTTWGNPPWRDQVARRDATAVARLKAAGAIIFGKTNVPHMLADWQSFNPVYGTTGNPWDPGRTPGGSSGGSAAALAAGLAALELGSDIGASIRNPAHFCGVCGHKPSWGIVPATGGGAPGTRAPADLAVLGPLARSVADLELALDLIAGPEDEAAGWSLALPPPRPRHPGQLRVAVWASDGQCKVAAAVQDGIGRAAAALAAAGAEIDESARPDIPSDVLFDCYYNLLRATTLARVDAERHAAFVRLVAESAPDDRRYALREARAACLTSRQLHQVLEQRAEIRAAWARFFQRWDVVLCPTAASPAFPHDQDRPRTERLIDVDGTAEPYNDQLFWAGLATLPLLPATVVPAGLSPGGLPVGVQIIGPFLGDRLTLAVARWIEQALGGFIPPPGH